MKKWLNFKYLSFTALLCFLLPAGVLVSCDDDQTEETDQFNRSVLLENMASELIVPNFIQLQSGVDQLSAATNTFTDNTNEANLLALREAWVAAVTDFQHCSAFGFGPGSLPLGPFADVIGVFPIDEQEVERNIGNPEFNLASSFRRDVRGFYTVEYLIYGNDVSETAMVNNFDADRKAYLQLVVGELKTITDNIVTEWNSTYLEEFTSNDGTSAGSPVSQLYNEFVKDYENLKNFKIELPAGLTAGQAGSDPRLVEAYYSGISRSLIVEQFENSKNIWFGRTRNGQDIVGFEEYLNSVVGGPELVETSKQGINDIDAAIAALPQGRLSEQVEDPSLVNLRNELQDNTAHFKSSMSSLLGISITYNSGDGD